MYDLVIEDATVLSKDGRRVVDIATEDGRIAYIGSQPGGRARTRINAIGRFLIPGVIDAHVHFRDPGHPHKETWASGSRAAATGGVTTVLDMPNTSPPTVDLEALRQKRERAAAASRVNFGLWAGATAQNIGSLEAMAEAGAIATKVFMTDTTGSLRLPDSALDQLFRQPGGLLGFHAEDHDTIVEAGNRLPAGSDRAMLRPPEAAARAVRRLVDLVGETGRRIHICHVSTAAELQVLFTARRDLPITVEACPHHLLLSPSACPEAPSLLACNPPIRGGADQRSLWTAIRRDRVDCIASDHAPHTRQEKLAHGGPPPAGIPGVEYLLPLMLGAVNRGRLGMDQLVHLLCEAPARIFGIEGKGVIEVGADADLVLLREGATHVLSEDDTASACGWSPYVGRTAAPKPELVLLAGRPVARDGKVCDDGIRGTEVRTRLR